MGIQGRVWTEDVLGVDSRERMKTREARWKTFCELHGNRNLGQGCALCQLVIFYGFAVYIDWIYNMMFECGMGYGVALVWCVV